MFRPPKEALLVTKSTKGTGAGDGLPECLFSRPAGSLSHLLASRDEFSCYLRARFPVRWME